MFYYYDPTYVLVLIGALICLAAQVMVSSAYSKWKEVPSRTGLTGAQVARQILDGNGCRDVRIEAVAGTLSDHYDPRSKVLRLSNGVYGSGSVAAIGVAAHECGHAMQHQEGYAPLKLRSALVPVVHLGSNLYFPIFLLGILFSWEPLITVGILCFALTLLFALVTLPVEFNASSRAIAALREDGYLDTEELKGAKAVLDAAALTYVASAISSLLQLLRLLILSRRRSRD